MKATCIAVITLILTFAAVAVWAENLEGTVKEVSGQIEWRRGDAAWQSLTAGQTIVQGDEIFTGPNGRAVISWPTGESTINPLSKITVQENMQSNQVFRTVLGVDLGSVRNLVDHSAPGTQMMDVNTPVGACGIRGSEVEVSYSPDMGVGVEQFAGHGFVSNELDQTSNIIAGQTSSIGTDGRLENVIESVQDASQSSALAEGADADEAAAESTLSEPSSTTLGDFSSDGANDSDYDFTDFSSSSGEGYWYFCSESGSWMYYDPNQQYAY